MSPLIVILMAAWSVVSIGIFVTVGVWLYKRDRKAEAARAASCMDLQEVRASLRGLAQEFPPVEPVFGHRAKSGQAIIGDKECFKLQGVRLLTDSYGIHMRPNAIMRMISGLQACSIPWTSLREIPRETPAAPKGFIERWNTRAAASMTLCEIAGRMRLSLPTWCFEQHPDRLSTGITPGVRA